MRQHIDLTIDLTPRRLLRAMQDFSNGLQYIADHSNDLIENSVKTTIRQMRSELNEGYHRCIEEYYNAYKPGSRKTSKNGHVYHRTYDLYNAYKIVSSGKYGVSVLYGPQFMHGTHRAPSEDIYYLAFMRGAHGGAQKGPNHPNVGVPYWHAVKVPGVWAGETAWSQPILSMIQSFHTQYQKRPNQIFNSIFYPGLVSLINQTNIKRYI